MCQYRRRGINKLSTETKRRPIASATRPEDIRLDSQDIETISHAANVLDHPLILLVQHQFVPQPVYEDV